MALRERHCVFAIDNVGRPAFRLTNAAEIPAALVVSLIHHDDSVRTVFLDQLIHFPALVLRKLPSDVQQLIERVRITAMQFGQLPLYELVVVALDRYIPIELALIVRIRMQ